jgi:Fe-S cluster assembly protein SufD
VLPLTRQTSERVTASLPDWARDRAAAGLELFAAMPMPDPKEEDWRYVEIPVDLDDLHLAEEPGSPLPPDGHFTPVFGEAAGRALNVDGSTVAIDSPDGTLTSLAGTVPDGGEADLLVGVPADLDRFAAAHRAFLSDGVVLRIPAGRAVERPYVVEFQATAAGTVAFPHLSVVSGDGSDASLVVLFRSADGTRVTVVPQLEMRMGDNARLAVTMVQAWGDATYAVAQQRIGVGRDSSVTLAEAGIGGSNARLHLTVDLEGRGADARILGVYFGDHDQTLDYRYFMNHRAPNTTSEMFLKGAVGDTAAGVFTGLIRIEPAGQKTNAHQTNRNLVLSEGAEAHSVPNLEILANDVRCGHGSAVGPLDEEQRYYLMSRGLDRIRADRLQVLGFFEDVLGRFPAAALERPLADSMLAKYEGIVERETS